MKNKPHPVQLQTYYLSDEIKKKTPKSRDTISLSHEDGIKISFYPFLFKHEFIPDTAVEGNVHQP
jgi:hypothetical protein